MRRLAAVFAALALAIAASLVATPAQAVAGPNQIEVVHSPWSNPTPTSTQNEFTVPKGGVWVTVKSNGPSVNADGSIPTWGETGRAAVRVSLGQAAPDNVRSYRFGVYGGTLSGCVNVPIGGTNISNPPNSAKVIYVTDYLANCQGIQGVGSTIYQSEWAKAKGFIPNDFYVNKGGKVKVDCDWSNGPYHWVTAGHHSPCTDTDGFRTKAQSPDRTMKYVGPGAKDGWYRVSGNGEWLKISSLAVVTLYDWETGNGKNIIGWYTRTDDR